MNADAGPRERTAQRAAQEAARGAARPVVIGLAGGVGAGKSTVARAFASLGCFVSDSDAEAKRMLDDAEVVRTLLAWWGEGVLDAEGRVDRRAVAAIVFEDPAERARLESLIHPRLKAGREAVIRRAAEAGAPGVIVDAPLLFEAGIDGECDLVVFVDAPRSVRLDRVRSTRGWDEAELERRERSQLQVDEKRRRCGASVENAGNEPGTLIGSCRSILDRARPADREA